MQLIWHQSLGKIISLSSYFICELQFSCLWKKGNGSYFAGLFWKLEKISIRYLTKFRLHREPLLNFQILLTHRIFSMIFCARTFYPESICGSTNELQRKSSPSEIASKILSSCIFLGILSTVFIRLSKLSKPPINISTTVPQSWTSHTLCLYFTMWKII